MTNKWVGIPAVPKGSPGEYTFLDAIKQNLLLAQASVDALSAASASGTGSVLAGTGLTGGGAVSTNPTISAGPDLAAIATLSDTGLLKRVGPGSYIVVPSSSTGAPGDSYGGDPVGSYAKGWLHEDTLTGNVWASGSGTTPASPAIVHYATASSVFFTTPTNHYELTLPFTPAVGNLVVIGVFNNNFTTAPTGWTIIHQAAGAFTNSTWYAKVWAAGDATSGIYWPDGPIPLHCYELSGVGTGTVASAFDAGQTVGVTGGSVSGFSIATAVANEMALCLGVTSSISETTLGMDGTWTMDNTAGYGTGSAAHKTIPSAGTTVTGTQTSLGFFTNRDLSVVTFKPGVINSLAWKFIGPVSTYASGTRIDTQLRSINFTGNVTATTDNAGNISVYVPYTSGAGSTAHFGTGAPSTLYLDGDTYYDTTTTPYSQYIQNASAWVAVGASGGGLTVGTTAIASGTAGAFLYNNAGVLANISLIPVANGGTGTATPSIVAGTGISVTGSWPNQTITATGGGGGGSTSVSFGTGAPSSSSVTPSVEGTPVTSTFTGGTSSSITFSTTNANRVAVLVVGMEVNGATLSLTSVTSPHLTWHKRTGFSNAATRGSTSTVEIWWASVPTTVTSEVVSFTLSATVDDAAVGLFVVKDLADITSPWDPNVGLPVQNGSSSPGTVIAAVPVFSTTNPNGLAFTASWSSNATNDTASWTALLNANNGGGSNWGFLTMFQQGFATVQTATTSGLTSGDSNLSTRMLDVLTGYRGAAPSEGSIYYDTSTTPYTGYAYHSGTWHQAGLSSSGLALSVPLTTPDLVYCWDSAALGLKASSGYTLMSMKNLCPWNSDFTFYRTTAGQGITVDATTLNGYAVVSGAAVTTSRYTANLPSDLNLKKATIIAVVNMAGFAGFPELLSGNTNALTIRVDNTGKPQLVKCNVAVIGTATTSLATGTWTQINATYEDAAGAFAFRVAKAAAGSGTNIQTISAPWTSLLYNGQTVSGDWNGKLAFLAVYNRVLTSGEIAAIEAYITATYGI